MSAQTLSTYIMRRFDSEGSSSGKYSIQQYVALRAIYIHSIYYSLCMYIHHPAYVLNVTLQVEFSAVSTYSLDPDTVLVLITINTILKLMLILNTQLN